MSRRTHCYPTRSRRGPSPYWLSGRSRVDSGWPEGSHYSLAGDMLRGFPDGSMRSELEKRRAERTTE